MSEATELSKALAKRRKATATVCKGRESMTRQEFKADADINVIMARCMRTGGVTNYVNQVAPVFADVSRIPDFQALQNRLVAANDAFAALPARVREFFGNNPSRVIDFVRDPKNLDKAVELGLAVRKPLDPPKADDVKTGVIVDKTEPKK